MTDFELEAPEVELLSNGRIRVRIDEQIYNLRRPKIGEFRKMREAIYDIQDELQALPGRLNAEIQALDAEIKAATDETDLAEIREKIRDLNRSGPQFDQLYVNQMRSIFDGLSDVSLPESDDDLPLWMSSPKAPSEFINHWRDTPLAFGEQ